MFAGTDESFRDLAERIPQFVYVYDGEGHALFVNGRFLAYLGVSLAQALAFDYFSLIHPDDRAAAREAWELALATGEPFSHELRMRSHSGTYRWFISRASAVTRGSGLHRWYGTMTDIDEQKHAEQSLQQLVETIPQMVWMNDPANGALTYVNDRWLKYFGLTREQNATWSMKDYAHPDDVPGAYANWKDSLRSGAPYETEYRLRRADGTYRWFLARGLPVRDAGGTIVNWFGSATDIDDRRRQYEQTQRVADVLQDAFIPRTFPQRAHVRFDADYRPAENTARVGGDWYDAFELDDGTIVFSVGDVAGHGLEAAATMANIRQAILGASIGSAQPSEVLQKVNRILCLQRSIMATAIVGFIRGSRVDYSTAGHPPAIRADNAGAAFLPFGGMPLGVDRDAEDAVNTTQAPPGTTLVLYTDGLTESRHDVDADEKVLLEACAHAAVNGMGAAGIRDAVLGSKAAPDDTAIMTLRF